MITRYKTLFSLKVTHDYEGGVCADVGFIVLDDVSRRLSGAGMVAKVVDGVFSVFHAVREPPLPGMLARTIAGETLRIGLVAAGTAFANITDGFDPAAGVLLYRNGSTPGSLDEPTRVRLGGSLIQYALSRAQRPVTVTVRDAAGRALRTVTVADEYEQSIAFDLGDAAPGAFALAEDYAGATVYTSHYADSELWRAGAFAVIELRIDASFYAQAPSFTVAFRSRDETMRYYVVARGFSAGDVDQLAVRDAGVGGRPDEVKFERVAPDRLTADERSQTERLAGDGVRVLVFRSLTAVRRRPGRKRIQLLRNNEALVENLPQPGRDRATADLIVHLSKSKT